LLTPFVNRVVIANPLQVKAIAHARVKTDKVDAKFLANFTPQDSCLRFGLQMMRLCICDAWFRNAMQRFVRSGG